MGFGNNSLTIDINARDNASATLAKVRANIQANSEAYRNAGKKMMMASAVISAAIGVTIHTAAKFEKQMAQVSTMLDKHTMSYMPGYEKAIKKMAIEFGEGTQALSNGLYDILSASIPPAKAMEVLEVSVKAAKAGLTDAGVAADAITTILNSYGLSADKAGSVSDLLFAIVKRGKLTFAELAPNIGKVAAMAAKTGINLENLGATISTLTRSGVRVEMAMTAIRGTMNGMLKPGKEAADMFRNKLGMEMNTTTLKAEGLIGILTKMKKAGLKPEEISKMFPNVRALTGVIAAMGDLEGITEDYNLMVDRAGLSQEAFMKNTSTTAHQLARLKQAFVVLSMELGKNLLPAVNKLAKAMIDVIKYLNSFSSGTKAMVTYAAVASAAILGLGGAFLFMLGSIGKSIVGMKALLIAINSTKVGTLALAGATKVGFAGAVAFAVYQVTKLIAHVIEWRKQSKFAKEQITWGFEEYKKALTGSIEEYEKIKLVMGKLTSEEKKQIKIIQGHIDMNKNLMESTSATAASQLESIQNVTQMLFDFKRIQSALLKEEKEEKEESKNEEIEAIYELSEKEKEMMQELSDAFEAIDLTSYNKKKKLIEKEYNDKKQAYVNESKDLKAMMAYEVKLRKIKDKRMEKLDKEELKRKSLMTNEIMSMTVSALMTVLEAEGSATKKRKGLYITLLAMEKALAIARLWSAEASKGVLGIATAIAGTATLTAQFVSITKGMKETKIPEITSPEIPVRDTSDFGVSTNEIPYETKGVSSKSYGSAAPVQKTEINLGGINLNFDVENLGDLTPADLDTLMRDFAEAVKAKTIEGLSLAKSIYNAGELLQEEAT